MIIFHILTNILDIIENSQEYIGTCSFNPSTSTEDLRKSREMFNSNSKALCDLINDYNKTNRIVEDINYLRTTVDELKSLSLNKKQDFNMSNWLISFKCSCAMKMKCAFNRNLVDWPSLFNGLFLSIFGLFVYLIIKLVFDILKHNAFKER